MIITVSRIKMSTRYVYFILFALLSACTNSENSVNLKEGDILFQQLNCGELCQAIEAVTDGVNGKEFSHCAIVVNINDTLKVVEAIGDHVQVNSIRNFLARSGDTLEMTKTTIGRVKKEYEPLIQHATAFAKKQIGEPYDDEFLMKNNKWYCSELLYESFKDANKQSDFFELEPMTFKDPKTDEFFPAWEKYYQQLNAEIPEGKAGINPGLISRSSKIQIISTPRINF
jgi:hypothetical protein